MPSTTPTGYPIPTLGDDPNVPRDILNLATALDKTTIPRFTTTALRDAAFTAPNPVATVGQYAMVNGNMSRYTTSGWVPQVTVQQTFVDQTAVGISQLAGVNQQIWTRTFTNVPAGWTSIAGSFYITSPGNAAASVSVEIGGVVVTSPRWHNHGRAYVGHFPFSGARNIATAGNLTCRITLSNDAGGTTVEIWDVQGRIWTEAW